MFILRKIQKTSKKPVEITPFDGIVPGLLVIVHELIGKVGLAASLRGYFMEFNKHSAFYKDIVITFHACGEKFQLSSYKVIAF